MAEIFKNGLLATQICKFGEKRGHRNQPTILHDRATIDALLNHLRNPVGLAVLSTMPTLPTIVLVLLLLLRSVLWLLLLAIASLMLLSSSMLAAVRPQFWDHCRRACQVDIHPASVLFRCVVQAELSTHLFHTRLDLLNMVPAVYTFANNYVKVRLALAKVVSKRISRGRPEHPI